MPKSEKGKQVLACACGYRSEAGKGKLEVREKTDVAEKGPAVRVIEKESETTPIDKECPKCDHGKAIGWTRQTRAGDEPETSFFRCVKCSHSWREY